MFETNPHFSEPSALFRLAASIDPALYDKLLFALLWIALAFVLVFALQGLSRAVRAARRWIAARQTR